MDTNPQRHKTLKSDVNRVSDIGEPSAAFERLRFIDPAEENAIIEQLIALDTNYGDDLTYECIPDPGQAEYNSNSFVTGILGAAALALPLHPQSMGVSSWPGFTQPVPAPEFQP